MSDQFRFLWNSGRLASTPLKDFWQPTLTSQDPQIPNLPLLTNAEPFVAITAQPTNESAAESATANFSVTATGATAYQWQTDSGVAPAAASVTGSAVVLTPGTAASPGAQSVTVPSDAEGVIAFWHSYQFDLIEITSDFSGGFTSKYIPNKGSGNGDGVGFAYARVTSTGSKNLTPKWGGTIEEGPQLFLVFVKGIPASDQWIRDSGMQQFLIANTDASATVKSTALDVVLAWDGYYGAGTPTVPNAVTGWTSLGTQSINSEAARLSVADSPGSSTTTFTSGNSLSYHVLAVVSVMAADPFEDVTDGSGGTTDSYTTPTTTLGMDGWKYRVRVDGTGGPLFSDEVTLTVTGSGTQTLTPSLFTNTNSFYAPTVSAGAVTLTQASRFDNSQSFYSATISQSGGTQNLTQSSRFDNSSVFYAPTLTASYSLTPARFDNSQSFYAPTVSPGGVTLSPARFDNSQDFYSSIITTGAVTLSPARFDNTNSFYSPTVSQSAASQELTPNRFDNTNAFYAPSVTTGPAILVADRFDNENVFFQAVITGGEVVTHRRHAATRKNYIIKGKKYHLNERELAILLAQMVAELSRKDIKLDDPVKPKNISRRSWLEVKKTLQAIEATMLVEAQPVIEAATDDDDDEDALLVLY